MKYYLIFLFFWTIVTLSLASEPQNIDLIKRELVKYYNSGEYDTDVRIVVACAKKYLDKYMQKNIGNNSKVAVIFDIDDTILSIYPLKKRIDFGYTEEIYRQYIAREQQPAIKPTVALCNYAKRRGFFLFFITGRPSSLQQKTEKNLKLAGCKNWDALYLKPDSSNSSTATFKAQIRKKLILEGYVIAASIGDQNGDLYEGCADCNFKLPNPFYLSN